MKQSEFVKWLRERGATFEDRKSHLRVYCNGEMSHLPRHPAKELKKGLLEAVKKQLKLK